MGIPLSYNENLIPACGEEGLYVDRGQWGGFVKGGFLLSFVHCSFRYYRYHYRGAIDNVNKARESNNQISSVNDLDERQCHCEFL